MQKYHEFEKTDTIRVSCAALARIIIDDKYLFILNKNSVKVGQPVYGPLGGALSFFDSFRPTLEVFGATFEKESDLRLTLPITILDTFIEWFKLKKDRECSTIREVIEELVDEEHIVNSLYAIDVQETYLKTILEQKNTQRAGLQGTKTQMIFEIYDVLLPFKVQGAIKDHIIKYGNESTVILLSKEEILTDHRLGTHCKHII